MAEFPLIGLQTEFLFWQGDLWIFFSQLFNNLEIFLLLWTIISDRHTKSRCQWQLLLHCIRTMQFILRHIRAIAPGLADQMSAVRSCIDQNIIRFGFQAAFDHRFEIFILNFKFFKRKIIHINNKTIIAVFDLCNDLWQILKFMFIHFDHAQAPAIVFI